MRIKYIFQSRSRFSRFLEIVDDIFGDLQKSGENYNLPYGDMFTDIYFTSFCSSL